MRHIFYETDFSKIIFIDMYHAFSSIHEPLQDEFSAIFKSSESGRFGVRIRYDRFTMDNFILG